MVLKTKNLQLEYAGINQPLSSSGDERRFTTIDTQLNAIFRSLGNGRISDQNTWVLYTQAQLSEKIRSDNITAFYDDATYFQEDPVGLKSDRYVYLSPGYGHVNYMAVETTKYIKIGFLPYGVNYIYIYTKDSTPLSKDPKIEVTNIEKDSNNTAFLLLGVITINDVGGTITYDINQNRLLEVSTLSVTLKNLIQHTHGKDGISKIDLSNEVQGFLNADSISDIDPSRINTGTLNPSIVSLSHLLLKDSGEITHAELDSAVALLQQSNKKLFGDLTSSNLLQSIIAVKKNYSKIDKYFRNLITIIPGYDNITNLNDNSFLDHSSYVFSYDEENDKTVWQAAIADIAQEKRSDAAIADFQNSEFRGIKAGGTSIGTWTVDTYSEFNMGRRNNTYVDINGDEELIFGYGYGSYFGDYFDVFGVATGTFINGIPWHHGYASNLFKYLNWGYGFGYQYSDGGDFSAGNVNVTLKSGKTDVSLYLIDTDNDSSSIAGDFLDSTKFYQNYFGSPLAPTSAFETEQFYVTGLIKASGSRGSAIDINYYDSLLRYTVNSNSSVFDGDVSNYGTLQITFRRNPELNGYWYKTLDIVDDVVVVTEHDDYTFEEDWVLRITFKDDSYEFLDISELSIGETINASTVISIPLNISVGNSGKNVKRFEIMPKVKGNEINTFESLTGSVNTNFNYDDIPGTTINDQVGISNYTDGTSTMSYHLPWARAIDSIGLSGKVKYSEIDTNNTVDQLYIVIPSSPGVEWQTISWIASEPEDSRVVIKLRSIDSNNVVGNPYTALSEVDFGHSYSNTSGSVESGSFEIARPSGSPITEGSDNDDGIPRGTHLEIKVILQPSSSGLSAPSLHSITVSYLSNTGDSEYVISGSEGFNPNLQTNVSRINITLTPTVSQESLEIKHKSDISKMFLGAGDSGNIKKMTRGINQNFILPSSDLDNLSISAVKSPHQIINNKTSAVGKVYAVKQLINHDLVVCDTENHRILILDSNNNYSFKTGIYGSIGLTDSNRTTSNTGIDKYFSLLQAIYNRKEKTIYLVFSHMLDDQPFSISAVSITSSSSSFNNHSLTGVGLYSNTLQYDFLKYLSSESKQHIRIPSGFYISNQSGNTQGVIASNVIRISLSDSDIKYIDLLGNPKQINVLVYNRSTSSYLVPVHSGLNRVIAGSGTTGSNSTVIVTTRLYSELIEANIYYRPIINPIDVEVLNDNGIVVCNCIGSTETSASSSEFNNFNYFYRTTSGYELTDATASGSTHKRIQFYDIGVDDLLYEASIGNAKFSQGNIDSDVPCNFSIPLTGSFKEVELDGVYYYLISDVGNQRVFLCDNNLQGVVWECNFKTLSPTPGDSSSYYPTCADKTNDYYYISIIGYGNGIAYDNKILQMDQTNSYSILLDKKLSKPLDINVYNNQRIVIST